MFINQWQISFNSIKYFSKEKFVFNFLCVQDVFEDYGRQNRLDETFIRIAIRSEEENEICLNG